MAAWNASSLYYDPVYDNPSSLEWENRSAVINDSRAWFPPNWSQPATDSRELNHLNHSEESWQWDTVMYPSGYTLWRLIVTSFFVTIIMIIMVGGNILVIIAIATEKSLKGLQNWFIASLAVADCLLGLIIMPFSLANEMMGYWVFGQWWCDIHSAVDVLLCTSSIMNICLISLDRYWSITHAVEYLRMRTPSRVAIMITVVWILAGLISIPPLLGWKKEIPQGEYPTCELSKDIGYVLYSALGSFYIPSCIMVVVYIRIYFATRNRARRALEKQARRRSQRNLPAKVCNNPPQASTNALLAAYSRPKIVNHAPLTVSALPPTTALPEYSNVLSSTPDVLKEPLATLHEDDPPTSLKPESSDPADQPDSNDSKDSSDSKPPEPVPAPELDSNMNCGGPGAGMKSQNHPTQENRDTPDLDKSSNNLLDPLENGKTKSTPSGGIVALEMEDGNLKNRRVSVLTKKRLDIFARRWQHRKTPLRVTTSCSETEFSGSYPSSPEGDYHFPPLSAASAESNPTPPATTLHAPPSVATPPKVIQLSAASQECPVAPPTVDMEGVSELEPSSSDSGTVLRCTSVRPLKLKFCRPSNQSKKTSKAKRQMVDLGKQPVREQDPARERRRLARKREKRATFILGLIMGAFILCWLPFFFLYILSPLCPNCIQPWGFATAFWLGYINSALNPVIYTIFNKDFRRGFRRILFRCTVQS